MDKHEEGDSESSHTPTGISMERLEEEIEIEPDLITEPTPPATEPSLITEPTSPVTEEPSRDEDGTKPKLNTTNNGTHNEDPYVARRRHVLPNPPPPPRRASEPVLQRGRKVQTDPGTRYNTWRWVTGWEIIMR